MAKAPKTPKDDTSEVPQSVTLSAPHGFIDDEGNHRYWQQGQVVTAPEEIALLIERSASIEE